MNNVVDKLTVHVPMNITDPDVNTVSSFVWIDVQIWSLIDFSQSAKIM